MVISEIALIISLALKIFSAYYFIIGVFTFVRSKKLKQHEASTRFAVLIPARNEACVIGQLVDSLKKQNYPKSLYDIYVVANNCTDNTSQIALLHGAEVFECYGNITCKGDALKQSLEYLISPDFGYDAFCVFDADNVVDLQYLAEMNNAFVSGARIAKGRNEAKNPYDSWISGCYALYFRMSNLFYNRARSNIGLSARLVGTGFAIHRSVLYELGGWNTQTLTEDAEFSASCAARGIKIVWVPNAVAYDEEPNSLKSSMTQRKRWCSGLVQVSKRKLPAVFKSLRSGKRALKLDMLVFLLNPFFLATALIPTVLNIVAIIIKQKSWDQIIAILLMLAGGYAGGLLMAVLIVILTGGWDRRIAKSIFTYPIFLASWLPLQILAVFHTTKVWKPIEHVRSVSLDDVA